MYAKQKPVKCSVVFFNPLMLMVTNDMHTETNLEVSVWRFAKICMTFCYHQVFWNNISRKISRKTFVAELIFSIFANLEVGKYAEYCISSNKSPSYKCCI